MRKAIRLGTLFGIEFRLHFTWFIVFALVTVILVHPDYSKWQYWVAGVITSLLFFTSVIAHELAHSLVGRASGVSIESITLFIFGGLARMTGEVDRAGAEFKMALAGPVCSLVLGGLFGLLYFLTRDLPEPITLMLLWLAVMNGALAIFNLIPGFPLDGGRVLRSLIWYFSGNYGRATRIATRMGQGVGYSLIIGGIVIAILQPFELSWFDGIWIILVGWFLEGAASSSYRQLRRREQADELEQMASDRSIAPHERADSQSVRGN
jgi:Zn-dependent protease